MQRRERLARRLERHAALSRRRDDAVVLLALGEDASDEAAIAEAEAALAALEALVLRAGWEARFNHDTDGCDVFLSVRAVGASDTFAAPVWAYALTRAYLGWASERRFRTRFLYTEDLGDRFEALVHVEGDHAYGWLKGETGRHLRASKKGARSSVGAHVEVAPDLDPGRGPALHADDLHLTTFRPGRPCCIGNGGPDLLLRHAPSRSSVALQNLGGCRQGVDLAMRVLRGRLWAQEAASESTVTRTYDRDVDWRDIDERAGRPQD